MPMGERLMDRGRKKKGIKIVEFYLTILSIEVR